MVKVYTEYVSSPLNFLTCTQNHNHLILPTPAQVAGTVANTLTEGTSFPEELPADFSWFTDEELDTLVDEQMLEMRASLLNDARTTEEEGGEAAPSASSAEPHAFEDSSTQAPLLGVSNLQAPLVCFASCVGGGSV